MAPGGEFDAYTKRQFVTGSHNINSLADHHIWSTIKTLPATLPELGTVGHGPGLLEPFLPQIWMSVRGWGRRARAAVRGSRTLVDGFIKKDLIPSS